MTLTDQPNHGRVTPARTVLVSGASIAGPTAAYWLNRYGYEVTVVERAPAPRSGGYPIDIRGTALGVVERMGLLPRLREAHIEMERMTFYEGEGDVVATLRPQSVTGSVAGRDLEVRRGDLTDALYASVRDDVEFLFNDSIVGLDQSGHGVDVTFKGGGSRTFDLVIAADGMHSHTRELVFGPEEPFHRYLGYSFGILSMPNILGLKNEVAMWNDPGRAAAFYATGDEVNALLTFAYPETPFHAFGDLQAQRDLISEVFAGVGWVVPDMLAALREADDLFFDAVAQIRTPRWSSGRVALVGDSAFAPSFLTGQGTSLALVGAYMLAASLAHGDYVEGFAAYERDTRGFVTANQDLVGAGRVTLMPTTAEDLRRRDERLRNLSEMPPSEGNPVHSALVLPEPPVVERPSR
ncbi:FAD-dependent monooxygenase [Microbispora hainanensis]|uniref:FAD-dependent monooxygenase n=1 Tax=Microbispora hainanensis TaxID=568844 RepID=UPI0033D64034